MARLSYPLECFEQSDTVLDGLNDLTDVSSRLPGFLGIQASSICLVKHDLLNIASGLFSDGVSSPHNAWRFHLRLIETGHWLGLIPASVVRFGGPRMHIKILPIKVPSSPARVGFGCRLRMNARFAPTPDVH
jgi:hypothetical protein